MWPKTGRCRRDLEGAVGQPVRQQVHGDHISLKELLGKWDTRDRPLELYVAYETKMKSRQNLSPNFRVVSGSKRAHWPEKAEIIRWGWEQSFSGISPHTPLLAQTGILPGLPQFDMPQADGFTCLLISSHCLRCTTINARHSLLHTTLLRFGGGRQTISLLDFYLCQTPIFHRSWLGSSLVSRFLFQAIYTIRILPIFSHLLGFLHSGSLIHQRPMTIH